MKCVVFLFWNAKVPRLVLGDRSNITCGVMFVYRIEICFMPYLESEHLDTETDLIIVMMVKWNILHVSTLPSPDYITHLPLDKMAAILQTSFSFRHFQHWFR